MTPTETATILRQFMDWRRDKSNWPPSPMQIEKAIDAAMEMIDRLEAAEADALEQARLNGMGAEREAALLAKLEAAKKDRANFLVEMGRLCAQCDALRTKIEQMERQEPVAWLHESRRDSDVVTDAVKHVWGKVAVGSLAAYSIPLYLAPGAQPAPSVPDGFSREDLEAVADGLDGYEKTVNVGNVTGEGDDHLESTTAYAARFIRTMLAATPETKP